MRHRWIVHGRVQGVGFRWWAAARAVELGLTGWCRNRSDGTVEVEAEGSTASLAGLEALLRSGPSHAQVTACVRHDPGEAAYEQPGFFIRQ